MLTLTAYIQTLCLNDLMCNENNLLVKMDAYMNDLRGSNPIYALDHKKQYRNCLPFLIVLILFRRAQLHASYFRPPAPMKIIHNFTDGQARATMIIIVHPQQTHTYARVRHKLLSFGGVICMTMPAPF